MKELQVSIEDVFNAHPNRTGETEHLTKTEIEDIQIIFNEKIKYIQNIFKDSERVQYLLKETIDEYLEDCKNLLQRC